jgi:hypothetical protein
VESIILLLALEFELENASSSDGTCFCFKFILGPDAHSYWIPVDPFQADLMPEWPWTIAIIFLNNQ